MYPPPVAAAGAGAHHGQDEAAQVGPRVNGAGSEAPVEAGLAVGVAGLVAQPELSEVVVHTDLVRGRVDPDVGRSRVALGRVVVDGGDPLEPEV